MTAHSRIAEEMSQDAELDGWGIADSPQGPIFGCGEPHGGERRWIERESRSPAWIEMFVLSSGGREVPAVLTNLSRDGCRIKSSELLTPGDRIYLKVPRLGRLAADIIWADGDAAGAQFVPGTDMWEQVSA